MRIKNAGPSDVARLDRQFLTWFWLLLADVFLDLLVVMDGRPLRSAGCFLLIASAVVNTGCATLWQTTIRPSSEKPKVQCDASWFLQNPSKDVIERVANDRKTHIENVMATRANGVVSVPLSEAISGNAETRGQRTTSSLASPVMDSLPAVGDQVKASSNESSSGGLMIEIKGGAKYAR